MAFFNKGGEVLDFTLLQKKGLLKIKEDITPDVIDLTQQNIGNDNGAVSNNTSSVSVGASPFDMLNSLASVSGSSNATIAESQSNLTNNSDFSGLMVRVENLEYKLERLLEKFSAVEGKLTNM